MNDTEMMVGLFEKAFGNYNPILKKVLIEKVKEYEYDNSFDLPIITNFVFDNYSGKWNKPPDWPEIKEIINSYGGLKTACPVCRQYLETYDKKRGICSRCEREKQRLLEPPMSKEDVEKMNEMATEFFKQLKEHCACLGDAKKIKREED